MYYEGKKSPGAQRTKWIDNINENIVRLELTLSNVLDLTYVTHLIEMSHMSEISKYEYYTWF